MDSNTDGRTCGRRLPRDLNDHSGMTRPRLQAGAADVDTRNALNGE